ncbi:MAG: hypothetical protein ACO1TE_02705 [Prosthecobacter sp.]
MSDDSFSPAATPGQRKLFATLGAAVLVISLSLAFVLGGKKAPAAKDVENDFQIGMLDGSSIDLNAQATPDNWVENTVASVDGTETEPVAVFPPSATNSSIVQGDDPGSQPKTPPAPGGAAGAGAAQPAATPSLAGGPPMPVEAEPHAVAVHAREGEPAAGLGSKPNPATTPAGNVQTAQTSVVPSSKPATVSTGKTVPKAGSPASTPVKPQPTAPSPAAPQAIPVKVAKVVGAAPAASKSAAGGAARKQGDTKPVFVRPAHKLPGVVAQTRTLITEKQYSPPSAPEAAAKPAAEEKTTSNAPARVRQQEARSYAQQATRQLQQQKALPPTQRVRLPRRAETTNPAVWHEDDAPAASDERRPFGLVVAEEKPGVTPEGIPLRTDIPAGTSPLQQNGADKPLWKRPE